MNTRERTIFAEKMIIPVGLLGALLYAVGGPWDQLIHVQRGHTLLAVPHLIVAGGFFLYIFSGMLAFFILRGGRLSSGERNSLKVVVLGAISIPLGWAFDESWHWIFGTDMTAWSPPHVAIFFGMGSVLLGLALLEANRKKHSGWFSWSAMRLMFFFASIFFVALFFFVDFDAPGMAQFITSTRPSFSYPIAITGTIVFLALLTVNVTQRPGFATIASLIAWGYYVGIGLLLGTIDIAGDDPRRILPPFPIFVPAIVIDVFLLATLRKRSFPLPYSTHLWASVLAASLCYAGVIVWAKFYTHLSQQGSEAAMPWIAWYVFVLAVALLAEAASFRICSSASKKIPTKPRSDDTI